MAKVTAPLFSFGARGKLADALVYFPWKGVDAVRSYVVPANPNTAAQGTQRARMTSAVAEWHAALYTALDVTAWNRLANLQAGSLSGFNRMVQEFINEAILGNTWTRMFDGQTLNVTAARIGVQVDKASAGDAPTARIGLSPTNMGTSAAMVDQTGDLWYYAFEGLVANTLYYATADIGASADDWSRLGIYTQRTLAS